MVRKIKVDRRENGIIRKKTNNLDRLYVNKQGEDVVSKLHMRCCDGFISWNGSGMQGLIKVHKRCPLCDATLDTRKTRQGLLPVTG